MVSLAVETAVKTVYCWHNMIMSPFLPFATYIGCKENHKLLSNVTTALLIPLVLWHFGPFQSYTLLICKSPFYLMELCKIRCTAPAVHLFVNIPWRWYRCPIQHKYARQAPPVRQFVRRRNHLELCYKRRTPLCSKTSFAFVIFEISEFRYIATSFSRRAPDEAISSMIFSRTLFFASISRL